MPEEKMVSVSCNTLCKLQSAICSINDLASAVYCSALDSTIDGAIDNMRLYSKNADKFMCSYFWMLDHYNEIAAAVQAIGSLASIVQDDIIELEY